MLRPRRAGGARADGARRRRPAPRRSGTSPWMIANASRSWAPTPTSRRTAPRVRVVDDPAHLEAADLAGDDAVLDDRHGAAGLDRRRPARGAPASAAAARRAARRRPAAASAASTCQTSIGTSNPPARRASSPVAALGEDVERVGAVAAAPRPAPRRGRARASSSQQHPRRAVGDAAPRRAGTRRASAPMLATEVVADERLQLDAAQPAAPAGSVDVGHVGAVGVGRHLPALALRRSAC